MTTYTKVSETCFNIKFRAAKFNETDKISSDVVKHSELKWTLAINSSEDEKLNIYLVCHGNDSNEWNATVKATIKVLKSDQTFFAKEQIHEFHSDQKELGFEKLMDVSQLAQEGFTHRGRITIEAVVEIESIYGNHPERKHNFNDKRSKLSDVVLKVEGKPLYASKQMLSCCSPVFHAMFYSDFNEKSKNSIELKDLKFDEFERFLQLLYSCDVEINATNVASLLMLADRYNTPMITQQCESFLISTVQVTNIQKLDYAEKYLLARLQAECINSIKTTQKLVEVCVDVEKRDKKTLMGLIYKSISLLK